MTLSTPGWETLLYLIGFRTNIKPTGFSRQAAFMFPRFKLPSLTSIPLRFVWVNEGGPDAFHFRLVDPTGKPLVGPATPKSPQVIASCSDNGLPVPAWPS